MVRVSCPWLERPGMESRSFSNYRRSLLVGDGAVPLEGKTTYGGVKMALGHIPGHTTSWKIPGWGQ